MARTHRPDLPYVWRAIITNRYANGNPHTHYAGPYTAKGFATAAGKGWGPDAEVTIQRAQLDWEDFEPDESVMTTKREYSRDEPVALDQRDPSNSEPELFTMALEPDDNVYQLVAQDQGDLLETAPMQEPQYGDQS